MFNDLIIIITFCFLIFDKHFRFAIWKISLHTMKFNDPLVVGSVFIVSYVDVIWTCNKYNKITFVFYLLALSIKTSGIPIKLDMGFFPEIFRNILNENCYGQIKGFGDYSR